MDEHTLASMLRNYEEEENFIDRSWVLARIRESAFRDLVDDMDEVFYDEDADEFYVITYDHREIVVDKDGNVIEEA